MLLPRFEENYAVQLGCDEAGRGCLAGPVVAGAIILPENYNNPKLQDSKKISESLREQLRLEIMEVSLAYAIGIASPEEIDQINILNASILAMHRAIEQINLAPDILLIDGNRFKPYKNIPHQCIVKGDGKYQSIAAASILAKTHRDDIMKEYSLQYPEYLWHKNKGYASKDHIQAIENRGFTPIHRKTFKLKKLSKQLFLFD